MFFKAKIFMHSGGRMPYRILLPKEYDTSKKYPLVIFLHGSGERGNDNRKQLYHGGSLFLDPDNRIKYPSIVIFPQCAEESYWANTRIRTDSATGKREHIFFEDRVPTTAMNLLIHLTDEIINTYPVDKSRIYVGGISMGGMGTFEIVKWRPDLFAAAFPICGGAHPSIAEKLVKPAWWIFHGKKDTIVDPARSIAMAERLKELGAKVTLTIYPDAEHNSWDNAFAEPELLSWLFSHKSGTN